MEEEEEEEGNPAFKTSERFQKPCHPRPPFRNLLPRHFFYLVIFACFFLRFPSEIFKLLLVLSEADCTRQMRQNQVRLQNKTEKKTTTKKKKSPREEESIRSMCGAVQFIYLFLSFFFVF